MQSGLWSRDGPVPLVDVSVRAKVLEFSARVTVKQKYCHHEEEPLGAIFKFPLDLFGALCGFEVVVDGKQITAQVKKREEAVHLTMDDIDTLDTSYLIDEDQPDVFVCNIGNLEPGKEVEFQLTYVTELPSEGNALRFILPSSTISPNYLLEDSSKEPTHVGPAHTLEIKVDLVLPSKIEKVESPTHDVNVADIKDSQASVVYKNPQSVLEPNFVLLVNYANPHIPCCLVETDEESKGTAVMLSFFPQLSLEELHACEIIFLVDCSNSMGGAQLDSVKSALQLLLRSLPTGTYFNFIAFGSTFNKLYPTSVEYNDKTLTEATQRVKELDADLGETELIEPLQDVFSCSPVNNLPRQLFVITDGQVPKTNNVIDLVAKNAHNTRVFTFGIGDRVSHHLVRGIVSTLTNSGKWNGSSRLWRI
jgi:hypothetical protein